MFNSETILVPPLCKKMTLENHVIGYRKEGESTVVLLKQDDKVIFSMVIDSYQDSVNATIDLLVSNGIKYIDFLIWTHPHKDHSVGLDTILKKFCNENTKVVIPNIDTSNYNDIPQAFIDMYKSVSKINVNGAKKNGEIIYGEFNSILKKYNLSWNGENVEFTVCCLSPTSKLLANNKFNLSANINDFSVAVVIIFNNTLFVYGADIENKAINSLKINGVYLENVAFIKTPHHGSHSTSNIFDIIEIRKDTLCAITNFNSGDICLPENDILEEYLKRSKEVFLFNSSGSEKVGTFSSFFSMYNLEKILFDTTTTGIAYHFCNEK